MPTEKQTFVIVGAGLAGAKAAETLREEGFDGRVVLVGAEAERPYERPPLSKDYLRGETDREQAYVHEAGVLRRARDRAAHRRDRRPCSTRDGVSSRCRATSCWPTTGCFWRPAPSRGGSSVPGAELEGVHYLRTFADSDVFASSLGHGRQAGGDRGGLDRHARSRPRHRQRRSAR